LLAWRRLARRAPPLAELKHGKPTTAEDAKVTPFEVDHGLEECVGLRVEQTG